MRRGDVPSKKAKSIQANGGKTRSRAVGLLEFVKEMPEFNPSVSLFRVSKFQHWLILT